MSWGRPRRAGSQAYSRAVKCIAERNTPASCFIVRTFNEGDTVASYNPASGLVRTLSYADVDVELYTDFGIEQIDGWFATRPATFLIGGKVAMPLC